MHRKASKIVRRYTAYFCLSAFTVSSLGIAPRSYAAAEIPAMETRAHSWIEKLPAELGSVDEFSPGNPTAPFIIYIQDAHANPDAQASIRGLLEWFQSQEDQNKSAAGKQGMLVALEGAKDSLHPEYLDIFPQYPKVNEKIAQDLFQKGELTGAELFAWKRYQENQNQKQGAVTFLGVEDPILYREDLMIYRSLLEHQSDIDALLDPVRKNLELSKSRIFSPALFNFIRERELRKYGHYASLQARNEAATQLLPYIAYLAAQVKEHLGIDLRDRFEQIRFPNLTRTLALGEMGKGINREAVLREQKQLLEQLRKKAAGNTENEALRHFEDLSSAASARKTAEEVWRLAEKYAVPAEPYADLWKSTGETILRKELDSAPLFDEMDQLESLLVQVLAQSPKEKQLITVLDHFSLVERLLNLKLTDTDYAKFLQDESAILHSISKRTLLALSGKSKPGTTANLPAAGLRRYAQRALAFYRLAGARDRALVQNTLAAAADHHMTVLITGGFHSSGVAAELKAKGAGYAMVRPRITQIDRDKLYAAVMLDKNTDISAYLNPLEFTKQEALFLKSILEVGAPQLAKEYGVLPVKIGEETAQAISVHPVLSGKLSAQAGTLAGGGFLNLNPQSQPDLIVPAVLSVNPVQAATIESTLELIAPSRFAFMRPAKGLSPSQAAARQRPITLYYETARWKSGAPQILPERSGGVRPSRARSEVRYGAQIDFTPPKIWFSTFSPTEHFAKRDRKFYAFVPPPGKLALVLKIGGKHISAKIMQNDGTFMDKEISVNPVYAELLEIDAGKVKPREFDSALKHYAEMQGVSVETALQNLEEITVKQMGTQLEELINWLITSGKATRENVADLINSLGVTSHGPQKRDQLSGSGTYFENSLILPFVRGTSLRARLAEDLNDRFHGNSKLNKDYFSGKIQVLEDVVAAGAGEISPHGTFPGSEKLMYVSWGSRIASSLYLGGHIFPDNDNLPNVGEIGDQMVWFPETRSYEWVGAWTHGRPHGGSGEYFADYRSGNSHYSSENMAAYFGKANFRDLKPEEVIRAGFDMGRMLGAYVKALNAQYGKAAIPENIILGSVVPEDLGLYHPYLLDAIREGMHLELQRDIRDELGYQHGLLRKQDLLIPAGLDPDNEYDHRIKFQRILAERFGAFYAANYMRALAERASKSAAQHTALLSQETRRRQSTDLLSGHTTNLKLRRDLAIAVDHIQHYRYGEASKAVQDAIKYVEAEGDVPEERFVPDYRSALLILNDLQQEMMQGAAKQEGRIALTYDNLPVHEWVTPDHYDGAAEDFNREAWNETVETWIAFHNMAQQSRVIEIRDPSAPSVAAKQSVRLLLTDGGEILRLKARGLDVMTGRWAGPHFVKSRQTGKRQMHVGYVGFEAPLKELLDEAISKRTGTKNAEAPNVLIFSGGSGAPSLHVPELRKLTANDPNFVISVLLTNTDDGGSSWDIVEALAKHGYGIYPPPGDIVNALFNSFLPGEMLDGILDDAGRIKDDELGETISETVATRIRAARIKYRIGDGNPLLERFDAFEDQILKWMALVDREFFREGAAILTKKKASIRNLVLLGALLDGGLLQKLPPQAHENALFLKEAQEKFQNVLDNLARQFGIKDGRVGVSSYEEATLWARYEENLLLFKDSTGQNLAFAIKVESDGRVYVRNPLVETAAPVVLQDGATHKFDGLEIGNDQGRAYLKSGNEKWIVEESTDRWKTQLHNPATGQRIEIFNDGSGRAVEVASKFEKISPKGDAEKAEAKKGIKIGNTEIYLRSRLIIRQTNITETANFSTITDLGAVQFIGKRSLQEINPDVEGKAQFNNPRAVKMIEDTTDLILMGPGSFHTSLMPHFLSKGIIEALLKKKGQTKRIFVFNPNRDNETMGMSIEAMIAFVEKVASRTLSTPGNPVTVKFEDLFDGVMINDGLAPSGARSEVRRALAGIPEFPAGLSTAALQQQATVWAAKQPVFAHTPTIQGASLTAGIYSPRRELAAELQVSELEALTILVRTLLNPSRVNTDLRDKILGTAKISLGDMAFLLEGLSEQPVQLEGVVGDDALAKNGGPLAELLAILELASKGRVSVSFAVTDTDGTPGVNVDPFKQLLQDTFHRFQLGADTAGQNARFLPALDSSPKALIRLLTQQMQDPSHKNAAKGLLHEAVDFLNQFGFQHDVTLINQGHVNYAAALIITAGLLRQQLGEADSSMSIWNLEQKLQRYGGVGAVIARVEGMLANVRLILQAA